MNPEQNFRRSRATTHVRVVAHDATAMPSPEIRALARVEAFVAENTVLSSNPVARRFGTIADDASRAAAICSPATIAQTIWHPRPPAIVAAYGSAEWDVFSPGVTRAIQRIDVLKIARIAWPDTPSYDPVHLAAWLNYAPPVFGDGRSPPDPLLLRVQAVADILAACVMVDGDALEQLAAPSTELAETGPISAAFATMRGDPRLEMLVRLSARPMAPLGPLPDPWDDERTWYGIGTEDLLWVANAPGAPAYAREDALAELDRRTERDAAMLKPRVLLRRPPSS